MRHPFLVQWGWVVVFVLVCAIVYEQGLRSWKREYAQLHEQFKHLEGEKRQAEALHEDLLLQLNSQSDPEWVQLTLMRELGVVPDGQTKIFFN